MQRPSRSGLIGSLALTLVVSALPATAIAVAEDASASCYDPDLPTTVEEQRLDNRRDPEQDPVAKQVLAGTGFDRQVRAFRRALCDAQTVGQARGVLHRRGLGLWAAATERAQSADPAGELPATDDRGLYWARISMTKAIHQWAPADPPSDVERANLLRFFEKVSRGISTAKFSNDDGVQKVLVTGSTRSRSTRTSGSATPPAPMR